MVQRASERQPPTLHYTATAEPESAPEEVRPSSRRLASESERLSDRVLHWFTLGILAVVLAVWAVVGAIFWLPILLRTMVRFSLALVQSTMDDERPEGSASMLRNAVGFYRRGFVVAIEAVLREEPLREGRIRKERIDGRRMMKELAWAVVIWYFVLWGLGVAWSPGEIGAWIWAWPWGEAFGSLLDGITGFLDTLVAPDAAEPAVDPAASGATTG